MLETSRGNVRARAVICTLPTNLIAEEAVRFRPPLPDKVAAAAGLPLGYAEKAMLHLDDPNTFPVDGHLFVLTDRTETGSYDLRPLGCSCIQAFLRSARPCARGPRRTRGYAIDELSALVGTRSGAGSPACRVGLESRPLRARILLLRPAGMFGLRAVLAAPVDGRLFFEGEGPRPDFSPPHTGPMKQGSGPPPKSHEASKSTLIGMVPKASSGKCGGLKSVRCKWISPSWR